MSSVVPADKIVIRASLMYSEQRDCNSILMISQRIEMDFKGVLK